MDGVYTDKSKGLASTSSGSHWYVFSERTWHTTSMVAVNCGVYVNTAVVKVLSK